MNLNIQEGLSSWGMGAETTQELAKRRTHPHRHARFLYFLSARHVMCKVHMAWTAKRSNQSILKEINPEYSLEALMLKLEYFGHLMQRANSLEKTLMLGKMEGRRRRG